MEQPSNQTEPILCPFTNNLCTCLQAPVVAAIHNLVKEMDAHEKAINDNTNNAVLAVIESYRRQLDKGRCK